MAAGKKKWPVIAGAVFILGFVAAMLLSTRNTAAYHCEVCMTFNGKTLCRNGAAATKEDAQRGATVSACTDLGAGGLSPCQRSEPTSVTWK